jgi:DNA-binding NtrC family response regulator
MTPASDDTAKGRLLIFDDDELVAETFGRIVRRIGLHVRIVNRYADFLEALDAWLPTHIAIDLVMPNMDGVQVLRRLASRRCSAMIIITSGIGDVALDAARQSAEASHLNIAGVLPKPFTLATLRALLDTPASGPTGSPRGAHAE